MDTIIPYNRVFDLTKGFNLLYIEDDLSLLEETGEVFENLFSRVDTAIDGENGLEKYLSFYEKYLKYYDIVVTDISMPKMDGITLIKKIYEINKNQSIIVISAHSEVHYLVDLVNIGIERFLIKPHNYNTILNVLYNTSNKIIKSKEMFDSNKNEIKLNDDFFWSKKDSALFKDREKIQLTKNETLLMEIFTQNRYKISTLQEIFDTLCGDDLHLVSSKTLKSTISRLRKKIFPIVIENIYGMGYRLVF